MGVLNICWTDKKATSNIAYLIKKFKIPVMIETGTFKGINAKVMSRYVPLLYTVEKQKEYYEIAKERLVFIPNVSIVHDDGAEFLRRLQGDEKRLFYLDAHFYDKKAKEKFVVKKELKALKDRKNCVIVIHDFDNGLGHITYDGQPLDMDLLRNDLDNINLNFYYYTNELSSCDIIGGPVYFRQPEWTYTEIEDIEDNLNYVWSKPEKTYRGILYCLPKPLTKKEMKQMGLKCLD